MKIAVCVKFTLDTKLPLEILSGQLLEEGTAYGINPADLNALEFALDIKENSGAEVVVINLGSPSRDADLKQCLALGADRAVRIYDESIRDDDPYIKALVLAKAIELTGFDLILFGEKSRDTGNGMTGQMVAAMLNLPQIISVTNLSMDDGGKSITVSKRAPKGVRQKINCELPAVVTVSASTNGRRRYASWEKYLSSLEQKITVWDASSLGLDTQEIIMSPTMNLGLSFPKPRTKELPVPDVNMPTYDRILQLLSGGLSKRSGKVITGKPEEIIPQIIEILNRECIQ